MRVTTADRRSLAEMVAVRAGYLVVGLGIGWILFACAPDADVRNAETAMEVHTP